MDKDSFGEFASEGDDLFVLEGDMALGKGEEGVVGALLDVSAGVKLGAALADDDIAGRDALAAKALYAEALGDGIATELG